MFTNNYFPDSIQFIDNSVSINVYVYVCTFFVCLKSNFEKLDLLIVLFTIVFICKCFSILAAYSSNVTLDKVFTADHNDPTSEVYQQEAASFCASVDSTFQSSSVSSDYTGCVVNGFE